MSAPDLRAGLAIALEELVQEHGGVVRGMDMQRLADRLDHLLLVRNVGLREVGPSRQIVMQGAREVVDKIVDQLLAEGWVDMEGETLRTDLPVPANRMVRLAFYKDTP